MSPRTSLGHGYGGYEKKRDGEATDHSFAEIHRSIIFCCVPCPGVDNRYEKNHAATRCIYSVPKLQPMLFAPR
jgi:hypothetical protein